MAKKMSVDSTAYEPPTETAAAAVAAVTKAKPLCNYDGGAGFARRGYDAVTEWLSATLQVISSCDCATGCPGCVQSPKCGNFNEPLDKVGAVRLLDVILESESTPPGPT